MRQSTSNGAPPPMSNKPPKRSMWADVAMVCSNVFMILLILSILHLIGLGFLVEKIAALFNGTGAYSIGGMAIYCMAFLALASYASTRTTDI